MQYAGNLNTYGQAQNAWSGATVECAPPPEKPFLDRLSGWHNEAYEVALSAASQLELIEDRLFGGVPRNAAGANGPSPVPNGELEAAIHRAQAITDVVRRVSDLAVRLASRL